MNQNEKAAKLTEAVQTSSAKRAGELIVEVLLDWDEGISDIAADFVENEVGRFDWVNNWSVIKATQNPVEKVAQYLANYGLEANPQDVVDLIDHTAKTNPGRWK